MTVAICIKCGARKHGSWTLCRACRHAPFGEDDLAWSLILSDHHLSEQQLQDVSQLIASTGHMPAIDPDFWNDTLASIRSSAVSFGKQGLLPEKAAPKKTLMVSSAADRVAGRYWRSIRLFDVRLYHPGESVELKIEADMFEPPVIVLLSSAFLNSPECAVFFTDLRRERYAVCCVRLDDTDPTSIGVDGVKEQVLEVVTEPGRRRFLQYLKGLPEV